MPDADTYFIYLFQFRFLGAMVSNGIIIQVLESNLFFLYDIALFFLKQLLKLVLPNYYFE